MITIILQGRCSTLKIETSLLLKRAAIYLCYNLHMTTKAKAQQPKKSKLYLTLFTSTLLISAFTFGGGYVIVSLIRKRFVEELEWISEEEMLNFICIASSSPGPIAINSSALIGYHMAGIPGALITLLGTVIPPLGVITVIASFYSVFRNNQIIAAALYGMQAGVAAVITDVVFSMGKDIVKGKNLLDILIMVAAFAAALIGGFPVSYIILSCGLLGLLRFLWQNKGTNKGVK